MGFALSLVPQILWFTTAILFGLYFTHQAHITPSFASHALLPPRLRSKERQPILYARPSAWVDEHKIESVGRTQGLGEARAHML